MTLTDRQLKILNHVVIDGQAWANNAKEETHVLAKVARHEADYDEAVAKGNYKNRATRDEEERVAQLPTPMETWQRAMAKTDRMGMPRYLEDLITDNGLTMKPIMKVRYDEKIKIRGERP